MRAEYGIFGGDDRSSYLADELRKSGSSVITYELACKRKRKPLMPVPNQFDLADNLTALIRESSCVIGPVPYVRYEKEHPGSDITNMLKKELTSGQLFCAGAIPAELTETLSGHGVEFFDFFMDQSYRKNNAVLTAEGCFARVRSEWPGRIAGAKVLVAGYGCCGRAICDLFLAAGARVTVCVRRTKTAFEAYERMLAVCYPPQLRELIPQQDIVINTVPEVLFGESELTNAADTLFVEIASLPGGYASEVIAQKGLSYLSCPGLPGLYAPQAEAAAMADSLERYRKESKTALKQVEGEGKWRLPERESE